MNWTGIALAVWVLVGLAAGACGKSSSKPADTVQGELQEGKDSVTETLAPDAQDAFTPDALADEVGAVDTVQPDTVEDVAEVLEVVDPWTPLAEAIDPEDPACVAEGCVILGNDRFDGTAGVQVSNTASFVQDYEGQTWHFRPWSRFRTPHPGQVARVWLYTQGQGAVRLQLSTGFPGGHHPCLDEDTGADRYPVGPLYRMEVSAEAGWRTFDLTGLAHKVPGYDEFFLLMDQEGDARIGLAKALPPGPGDYASNSGIIADAPKDGMKCFPSMSTFTGDNDDALAFVVRAEILTSRQLKERRFAALKDGPTLGGHASLGDYDNDGDDDLLSNGTLYRNDGGLVFVNVTAAAGLSALGGETLWGDYDNDGWRDIVGIGSSTFLFHNKGDGTFANVSEASGLWTGTSNQGAAWVDVNGDGFLDLMVASYGTLADPEVAARDFLFINAGDGSFYNGTDDFGISAGKAWHGRGVCVADYDNDQDPDIYVGNYRLDPNFLWQNQGGDKGFIDVAKASGTQGVNEQGAYGHTIGPSFGDLDEDGWFDLVVPNLAHPRFFDFSDPTTVLMNEKDGTFLTRETTAAGIAYDETHSDSTLFDSDNDGDLDLFLTAVYEGRRSYLYSNDGAGMFADQTYEAGILHLNGWGAAASDLDGDGDVDLLASGVWQNLSAPTAWVEVQLVGGAIPGDTNGWSNRDAIGAVVQLKVGGRTLTRQVEGGKGVGCQNSARLHFGLAGSSGPVSLHVQWPSGRTSELSGVEAGVILKILERD